MQAYLKGVLPLLMGAGGQLVKRVKVGSVLTGGASFGMLLVMDFPDQAAVDTVFASEAYAALIPARDRGFSSLSICFGADL